MSLHVGGAVAALEMEEDGLECGWQLESNV
jgi:hypothetical protein